MGFAVGLFAVMQHRLCENKEVFRSGAGNTQSKLCALQRVADDLDLQVQSRNSSGVTGLFFG